MKFVGLSHLGSDMLCASLGAGRSGDAPFGVADDDRREDSCLGGWLLSINLAKRLIYQSVLGL